MKLYLYLIGILSIVFSSCKISNDEEFSGITVRDETGYSYSTDESDWNFSDNWNNKEKNLFSESFDETCELNFTGIIGSNEIYAYPNPCDKIIHIDFPDLGEKRVSFVIVDNEFNIILSNDSIYGNISLNFENLDAENEIVRMYYKVIGENCELTGHGDIEIK